MKTIGRCVSIIIFGFTITATSDSSAARILCKIGFSCPMAEGTVGNLGGYNDSYNAGSSNGVWEVTGPWGAGGTERMISGTYRCSNVGGSAWEKIGNPTETYGEHCWCRLLKVVDEEMPGVWVFDHRADGFEICFLNCSRDCLRSFKNESAFQSLLCTTPPIESCDDTVAIEEDACPDGYARCVGSKTNSDEKGVYAVNCSE